MVGGVLPYIIGVGLLVGAFFVAQAMGLDFRTGLARYSDRFKIDIGRADMTLNPTDFLLTLIGIGLGIWIVLLFVLYSNPLLVVASFPATLFFSYMGGVGYLKFRGRRRLSKFTDQLEMVMRMISGAVRVGMSLRQSLVMVNEEIPPPASREFGRVLQQVNLGINLVDALDSMARGLPGSEMEMFARVVRVQAKTGGDLAKVLDKLASTIRDRRQIQRKMNALTAQGRFGAAIIGMLPVGVGSFIMATQPDMREALIHTTPGVVVLCIAVGLEAAAIFSLSKILQLDV